MAPVADTAASVDDSGDIFVSLLGLVDLLPAELKPVKAVGDVASVQISIPKRLVVGQLAKGYARISFGELRRLAPDGFFTASATHDAKAVDLPLAEVLPQLTHQAYSRRTQQQSVYIPEDVTNVFAARGTPVAPTNKPGAHAVAVPSSKPVPPPAKSHATPATPVAARSTNTASNSTAGSTTTQFRKPPLAAPQLPTEPLGKPAKPADVARSSTPPARSSGVVSKAPANAAPITPSPGLTAPRPGSPAASATSIGAPKSATPPALPESSHSSAPGKPIAAPSLLAAMQGGGPTLPKTAAAPKKASPAPNTTPSGPPSIPSISMKMNPTESIAEPINDGSMSAAVSSGTDGVFAVPLSQVCAIWPNDITAEIAGWRLSDSAVMLLVSEVELSMRQGRVQYPWGELLTRLTPAAPPGSQSAHATVVVDLPLQIVAPLFLAARQNNPRPDRARSRFDASIPDLFHGGAPAPAPEAPLAPPPPPSVASARTSSPAKAPTPAPVVLTAPAASRTTPPSPVEPTPEDSSTSSTEFLSIPLAMIDESWADSLKSVIAHSKVAGLKLHLPYDEANKGLKSGRMEYTWKQLTAWMHPALPAGLGADHADKLLTLPLKVLAPMFLAQFKPTRGAKKAKVNDEIPDLFSGGSAPTIDNSKANGSNSTSGAGASESSVPSSASTGASAHSEAPSAASYSTTQFFRKPPADLGELFGQPGKNNWTPQEVVQSTTRVRGVAGAVIAMQDGLLVAAQLQTPWRPEATAAFLPQIYSRMNQYLKELGAGDLDSVTLSTPSGTLLVFSAGIIYFAVVSKVGEEISLPAIQLIVKELSRHSK